MKVESHSITYVTAHEFSYEKTDTFDEALSALSSNEAVREQASKPLSEMDLVQQMKFMLIQELLKILNGTQNEFLPKAQGICENQSLHVKNSSNQFRVIKTVEVAYEATYKEEESLSVQTQGIVQTKDGRSIALDLDFTIQRSFYSKTMLKESVMIDPLVITLDGNLPELCDTTFSFDIDCDGTRDQISCLDKNSGFLALDKNQNGQIDDGSELFGTQSGNSFKDLSQYDADANRWIDENDPIFDGLRIWSNNELIGLGEVGIGAIYLGAHHSPYTFKNDANESLGALRQSSVFLFESGEVGTISQIDFAKRDVKEPFVEALAKV